MLLVCFVFFPTLFQPFSGWSRWVPGIKKMPTEVAVSRPGARPTLNTPKRRKHKVNQQNKTKKRKKFRSFSSSLAEPTTVCNRRSVGEARVQKAASPPAPCIWRGATAASLSSRKGTTAPHSLPAPSAWGCSFTTQKMGRRKARVSLAPRGQAGQEKVRKVTALWWRPCHHSGSSLLLGYLWGKAAKSQNTRAQAGIPDSMEDDQQ